MPTRIIPPYLEDIDEFGRRRSHLPDLTMPSYRAGAVSAGAPAPPINVAPAPPSAPAMPQMTRAEQEYMNLLRAGPQVQQRGKLQRIVDALAAGSTGWIEGPVAGMQMAQQLVDRPRRQAMEEFQGRLAALSPQVERADYWRKLGFDVAEEERAARKETREEEVAKKKSEYYLSETARKKLADEARSGMERDKLQFQKDVQKWKEQKLSSEELRQKWFEEDPETFQKYMDAVHGRGPLSPERVEQDIKTFQKKQDIITIAQEARRLTPEEQEKVAEFQARGAARGRATVEGEQATAVLKPGDPIPEYLIAQLTNDPDMAPFIKSYEIKSGAKQGSVGYRIMTPVKDKDELDFKRFPEKFELYQRFLRKLQALYSASTSSRYEISKEEE